MTIYPKNTVIEMEGIGKKYFYPKCKTYHAEVTITKWKKAKPLFFDSDKGNK